jgi:hypothetical protein
MFDKLRSVLRFSENLEAFASLPDRLATLFEQYDSSNYHLGYRDDIYNILVSSLELAEALVQESQHGPETIARATHTIRIITNIINHLESRPALKGYAILFPLTRTIHEGVYATHQEANRKLESLHKLGIAQECQVVPVRVSCDVSLRPEPAPVAIAQSINEIEREAADKQLEKELQHDHPATPASLGPLNGNTRDREDL